MVARRSETAILTASLLLVGCRQIVGIEQRQVFGGDASLTACNLPTRGEDCASCMTTHCCEPSLMCVDACLTTEQCVYACPAGDSSCRLACSNRWGTVDVAQAKLQLCRDQSCADECGRWDCLGDVQWTISEHITETIQISATAKCGSCGPTGASGPLADVHVDVCSTADTGCEGPLASADTGADGAVRLNVNTKKSPQSVFLQLRKEGWLDDLVMLNTPPLSYDFDVGDVYLDQLDGVGLVGLPNTPYSPDRAVVKLAVGDCNLRTSDRIDLVWSDPEGVTIDESVEPWNAVAGNLAVPATHATRVVARLRGDMANASQDAGPPEPIVAVVNLVLRAGAITSAPFVTPTPMRTP